MQSGNSLWPGQVVAVGVEDIPQSLKDAEQRAEAGKEDLQIKPENIRFVHTDLLGCNSLLVMANDRFNPLIKEINAFGIIRSSSVVTHL